MSGSSTDTDTEPMFTNGEFRQLEFNELRGVLEPVLRLDDPDPVDPDWARQLCYETSPSPASLQQSQNTWTYVLPHAPPTEPAPVPPPPPAPVPPAPAPAVAPAVTPAVTSPVRPSGDGFVESAVNNTIPALEPWQGRHGFQVTVRTPPPVAAGRQQPYVFEADANKLYVDMNIAVTVAFRVAAGTDTERLRVSALPVYPDMHHVNTPVRRCPTHRQPELECNAGAGAFIDHVIRAEHDDAIYQEMGTTKERRSVVVPYEPPPPGTNEYRVAYKLVCMNTCVGGINRRRLVVLFTLEDRSTGEALGRQTLEVKVCKCPHRDSRTDRIRRRPGPVPVTASDPTKRRLERSAGQEPPEEPPARRRRAGRLVVEADDLDEYDHLVAVLASFRAVRRRRRAIEAPPIPPLAESGETEERAAEMAPAEIRRMPTMPVKMERP